MSDRSTTMRHAWQMRRDAENAYFDVCVDCQVERRVEIWNDSTRLVYAWMENGQPKIGPSPPLCSTNFPRLVA